MPSTVLLADVDLKKVFRVSLNEWSNFVESLYELFNFMIEHLFLTVIVWIVADYAHLAVEKVQGFVKRNVIRTNVGIVELQLEQSLLCLIDAT